jgi:hypothetical protein
VIVQEGFDRGLELALPQAPVQGYYQDSATGQA